MRRGVGMYVDRLREGSDLYVLRSLLSSSIFWEILSAEVWEVTRVSALRDMRVDGGVLGLEVGGMIEESGMIALVGV